MLASASTNSHLLIDSESKKLREEQKDRRRKDRLSAVRSALIKKAEPSQERESKPSIDDRLKARVEAAKGDAHKEAAEVQKVFNTAE